MKKTVSILVVLGMFQVVFSQGDFDRSLEYGFPLPSNLAYLSETYLTPFPGIVRELQLKAASFTIFDADGYQKNKTGSFMVVHKASNGKVTATYDKNGEIITTWERFSQVSLPKQIRELIATKYTGWKVVKTNYRGSFSNGRVKKALYTIKMANGNKIKRIRISGLDM